MKLIGFAVAVALLSAACGDASSSTRAERTSAEQRYREAANGLCRAFKRKADAIAPPAVVPDQIRDYFAQLNDLQRKHNAAFARLSVPPSLADLDRRERAFQARFLAMGNRTLRQMDSGGDPWHLAKLFSAKALPFERRENHVLRRLGLRDCLNDLPG